MSQLSRALAWAQLGFKVHPCYGEATWNGTNLHAVKTPVLKDWPNQATVDPVKISSWFNSESNFIVGVIPTSSTVLADIDKDVDSGKDGFFELEESGLSLPTTFEVQTPRGGSHFLYRRDEDLNLSPYAGLVLENGVKLPGVDRRAGNSYFIAWSDEVPSSTDALAAAPEWLLKQSGSSNKPEYKGTIQDWFDALPKGVMSPEVISVCEDIPKDDFGHDQVLKLQARLVHLGAEGLSTGVAEGLAQLAEAWLREPYNSESFKHEFISALTGAIAKFGGARNVRAPKDVDEEINTLAERIYLREKATLVAKRRIADETFTGSKEVSWEELQGLEQEYIVDGLIAAQSVNFLVARRNLGKTFLVIDLVCRMACGLDWLGKGTKQVPVVYVIGEGKATLHARFESWCELNGQPLSQIKKFVRFIDGANLNSDTSIQRIKALADAIGPELIVFDTWNATSGVEDENAASLSAEVLNRSMSIRSEAACLFVHHPTKNTADTKSPVMRGSSALDGRADLVLTLFETKEVSPPKSIGDVTLMALSSESQHGGKNRHNETETIKGIYLANAGEKGKAIQWLGSETFDANTTRILAVLKSSMTVAEVTASVNKSTDDNLSEATIRRHLNKAIGEGVVIQLARTRANEPVKYDVATRVVLTEETNWPNLVAIAN
jgi:hypothetical protein